MKRMLSVLTFCLFIAAQSQSTLAVPEDTVRQLFDLIRETDREADINRKDINHIWELMQRSGLQTTCKVEIWLKAREALDQYQQDVMAFLEERFVSHEKHIDTIYSRLVRLIEPSDDDKATKTLLKGLAQRIAANESSLRRVEKEIVPFLEDRIQRNKEAIHESTLLVSSLHDEYRREYLSVCQQLRQMKVQLDGYRVYNEPTPADPIERTTVLRPIRRKLRPNNPAIVLPTYIVTRRQDFCVNARLIQRACDCSWVESRTGREEYYRGDLYEDCSGRVVLLSFNEIR